MNTKNNHAFESGSINCISDLYRYRLAEAKELYRMSNDHKITEGAEYVLENYRTRSWNCEIAATCLAHCAIQFGDILLSTINFDELSKIADGMSCEGRNPLLWGLIDIKKYLSSLRP